MPRRAVGSHLAIAALLGSTALLSLPDSALAACTGVVNVVCSGPLTTQQVIPGNNTSVTTASGFSVITTDPFPLSFPLYIAGNGALSYTDVNASTLSSTDLQGYGLSVISTGNDGLTPGSVTIDTNGQISAGFYGINASNSGTGVTSVIARADVTALSTAANASAIHVINTTLSVQDMTVQANGVVKGGYFGIDAYNNGTGSATITATKDVTGTNYIGIYGINGATAKDLSIVSNGTATGAFYGIAATNNGTGLTSITSTVNAVGTASISFGIAASNTVTGNGVTVKAAAASGATGGVSAVNYGGGATSVTTTGAVTATDAVGIGIDAQNFTASAGTTVTVGATGIVKGGRIGINAVNNGTGSTEVTATKDVTGTSTTGIHALNAASALDLTVGTDGKVIGGGIGIDAVNNGKGSTKITATGDVTGTSNAAISAANATSAVDLDIEAGGTVVGGAFGINALNNGTGKTTVTSTGKVTGTTSIGIAVNNSANGAGVTVDAVDASGLASGISVQNSGKDVAAITARGTVEGGVAGISATSSGQAIEIDVNGVNALVRNTSHNSDSIAIQASGGATTINNSGVVTGIVSLGANADVFNNSGVWNMALGHAAFGGGGDQLNNLATGRIVVAGLAGTDEYTIFDGLETFANAGNLILKDGGAGDTVEFSGDYTGLGGIVQLDTVLGADTSKTDLLLINGSSSGTTQLAITNIGGAGARTTGDGIKVVEVDGPSSLAVFTSSTLNAGAYDYNLFQGGLADPGDGNWYLRSDLSATAQTVVPYTASLTDFSRLAIGTLQQRTGNRLAPNGGSADADGAGMWARLVGQHSSLDPSAGSAYDSDAVFGQVGAEGVVLETAKGQVLVGLSGLYGNQSVDVDVTNSGTGGTRSGRIESKAYGVGANVTWLGSDGLYVDGVGQYIWYDSDLSATGPGTFADGNHGDSYALSLEAGKRLALSNGWAWVPQAQLVYSNVSFDSFTTSQVSVAAGDSDSLLGRLGVRVEKQSSEGARHFQAYGIANVNFELLGDKTVDVSGEKLAQDNQRVWGELGFGGSFAFNDKTSLYGEVRYATSLENFGDSNRVGGNVGLKVAW